MKVLKGVSVSSGLVQGTVCLYSNQDEGSVPHYAINDEQVTNEIERLREGFEKTIGTLQDMIKLSEHVSDARARDIFNAHAAMLHDKGLRDKIAGLIREKKVNAEHAISDIFEEYINLYENSNMHFKELAHDFFDLKNRVLSSFTGLSGHFECSVGEQEAVVVASQRLTPYMVLNIPKEHVLAFIVREGGYTTHAMILARSLGIPVIMGIDVKEHLKCTDRIIVDGFTGKVIVWPDAPTEKAYAKKIQRYNKKKLLCDVQKHLTPRTRSNIRVRLKLNISSPGEIDIIKGFNHDGIGLLRTEFLFLERDHPPSEQEQFDMYKTIAGKAEGKPVIVRLLDIGSDKLPLFFTLPEQINPDLEIKGARAVEVFYDVYLTQAKAILRAAKYGDVRVLYPMVSDVSDIHTFKKLIADARRELKKEKKEYGSVHEGIMIETPAAALMADVLLKRVDFANIGSNDLLQYTLAASRGNPYTEKRYHILHPSLVKLFEIIIKAGKTHRKEICLCGEVGSFEQFYPVFLKMGLRSFSVAAAKFPLLKCELMYVKLPRTINIIKKLYQAETWSEVEKILTRRGG